jgi:hypothetical protein
MAEIPPAITWAPEIGPEALWTTRCTVASSVAFWAARVPVLAIASRNTNAPRINLPFRVEVVMKEKGLRAGRVVDPQRRSGGNAVEDQNLGISNGWSTNQLWPAPTKTEGCMAKHTATIRGICWRDCRTCGGVSTAVWAKQRIKAEPTNKQNHDKNWDQHAHGVSIPPANANSCLQLMCALRREQCRRRQHLPTRVRSGSRAPRFRFAA